MTPFSSNTLTTIAWLLLAGIALLAITFVVILPLYTIILAAITILRARKWHTCGNGDDSNNKSGNATVITGALSPWSSISTSLFQGTVFHVRHQPMVHSFKYPLYFSVVDLDEASALFGDENVHPSQSQSEEQQPQMLNSKVSLWPLSSLMLLRDVDHMKNGEGLMKASTSDSKVIQNRSMRERVSNLVHERTNGKLDVRSTINSSDVSERRKILLVTHLMYYGYCFNPVSFFFILKPNTNKDGKEEEIEAVVVEVSNTPWNEMCIYVLHPDSVDTVESFVYPPTNVSSSETKSKTYRYKWRKNFHVSPFMTMDHDYDWKFQVSHDRIKVVANMIKRKEEDPSSKANTTTTPSTNGNNGDNTQNYGILYFTAGFVIQRTIQPTSSYYPLQLAKVILRFPVYCFIIQIWIHYEAIRLLIKGVEFIPHPEGSETGASKAIAAVMRPVFAMMDGVDVWWSRWKRGGGKSKSA